MSFNLKQSSETTYPVIINRKQMNLSESQIAKLIRRKLKTSPVIMNLLEDFELGPDRIDDLHIRIADLENRYAETDETTMTLDPSLFEDGKFFQTKMFIVFHEWVHNASRLKEKDAYFNDPEEVLGFCTSIAYEISEGTDMNIIWNRIYPKIEFHFHNESDSREFFQNMVIKAKELLQ